MTRFSNFTDEELDNMESAFYKKGLIYLIDEIHKERLYRESRRLKNKIHFRFVE
mgnify:CR=1 FL=1